jgi:hypothetical protein
LFKQFQTAPFDKKEKIANRLTNPDARMLAIRLLCRNYPKRVSENFAREFEVYMRRVNPLQEDDTLVDYKGERKAGRQMSIGDKF